MRLQVYARRPHYSALAVFSFSIVYSVFFFDFCNRTIAAVDVTKATISLTVGDTAPLYVHFALFSFCTTRQESVNNNNNNNGNTRLSKSTPTSTRCVDRVTCLQTYIWMCCSDYNSRWLFTPVDRALLCAKLAHSARRVSFSMWSHSGGLIFYKMATCTLLYCYYYQTHFSERSEIVINFDILKRLPDSSLFQVDYRKWTLLTEFHLVT